MPRYFFNVRDGIVAPHIDDLGEELRDHKAAWDTAVRYAGDSLRDLDGQLRMWNGG